MEPSELLAWAGRGLPTLRFPGDEPPLSIYEEQVADQLELQDALAHVQVSEAVRAECRAELNHAARRGYIEQD